MFQYIPFKMCSPWGVNEKSRRNYYFKKTYTKIIMIFYSTVMEVMVNDKVSFKWLKLIQQPVFWIIIFWCLDWVPPCHLSLGIGLVFICGLIVFLFLTLILNSLNQEYSCLNWILGSHPLLFNIFWVISSLMSLFIIFSSRMNNHYNIRYMLNAITTEDGISYRTVSHMTSWFKAWIILIP